jgi:hypothetical protein
MLNVDCAVASPVAFFRVIEDEFGLGACESSLMSKHEGPHSQDVYSVIAAQAVAQAPRVSQLAGELEASSIPVGDWVPSADVNCDEVFQNYQRFVDDLQQENNLLELQFRQVKGELEEYVEKNYQGVPPDGGGKQDVQSKAVGMLAATDIQQYPNIIAEKAELESEIAATRELLELIMQSRSWKLTKPLRFFHAPFVRRRMRVETS